MPAGDSQMGVLEQLIENRNTLIRMQKEIYQSCAKSKGTYLHLGCNDKILEGFINIDKYSDAEGVCKDDIKSLDTIENSTVDLIICDHVLEHISWRHTVPALFRWHSVLKEGGHMHLTMPDLGMQCYAFTQAGSDWDRNWLRATLFGYQARMDTTMEDTNYDPGQAHMSGYSMGEMLTLLTKLSFRPISYFQYEGYGTPSFYVHAIKE